MSFDATELTDVITPLSIICDSCSGMQADECEHDLEALVSVGALSGDVLYDFIFVDSPSIELFRILGEALAFVRPNGFVMIDNATLNGRLADPEARVADPDLSNLHEQLQALKDDGRFETHAIMLT